MSWIKKFAGRNAQAGAAKVIVVERRQNRRQKNRRTKSWRLAAIGVVSVICSGPGLAAEIGFSEIPFQTGEMPAMAPDVQAVSYTTSQAPAGGGLTLPYQSSRAWHRRLTLGGYGEMHANIERRSEKDIFDLHRMVIFLGYEFTDWLTFSSELEVEHAFVNKSSGGELGFEQAYVEYVHNECLHMRAGRVLVPVGIINSKHEPPSFNGVERPSFAKFIIPSTWSADGIGITGTVAPGLKYQAYMVTSLDGSKFSETNGIRSGRIKERGSLSQMAFTGRLDYFPFATNPSPGCQTLRFGASTFLGGLANGNKGSDPEINANINIISADVEYSVSRFDLRCVLAYEEIPGAAGMALVDSNGNPINVASGIFGYYIEGAVHVFPQHWKCGRLRRADAVAFVRFDDFNTQYRMPAGVAPNGAGGREEWTFGITYLPIPTSAIKFDYQVRSDAAVADLADKVNFGVGFMF